MQQKKADNVQQNPASSEEANSSNDLQQKDAESDIVRTSSLQKTNNQSINTKKLAKTDLFLHFSTII